MDYVIIHKPREFSRPARYRILKRFIDISLCILLLPTILFLMLLCSIAIYLDSPGRIFFVQERMGIGGKLFKIYKFRTMQSNRDDSRRLNYMKSYIRSDIKAPVPGRRTFKPLEDEDVFTVGHVLRKLSLDELPQIINVLKGEMSIVGPRPNVMWEVEAYLPWHYERMEVLPGITGLAQVRGRSSIDFATLVRNDIEYIENQCLSLDLKILWWTFLSAISGRGAE